jgi:hypothetical protein
MLEMSAIDGYQVIDCSLFKGRDVVVRDRARALGRCAAVRKARWKSGLPRSHLHLTVLL